MQNMFLTIILSTFCLMLMSIVLILSRPGKVISFASFIIKMCVSESLAEYNLSEEDVLLVLSVKRKSDDVLLKIKKNKDSSFMGTLFVAGVIYTLFAMIISFIF